MLSSLLTGLVSYFKMDGNSIDSSGANNGTDTAVAYSSSSGKINWGALFNGISSFINLGSPASLNLGAGNAFTLTCWIYPTSDPTGCGAITEMYSPTSSTVMYELGFDMTGASSTKLQLGFHKSGIWYTATDTINMSLNVWTHIAGTWDGITLKVYKNGILVASSIPGTAMPTTFYDSVRIGCRHDTFGPQPFFPGSIDEGGIWSRALTDSEISSLYNTGVGKQYPFNGFINSSKPVTSIVNTLKVSTGETWATILTSWLTETRTWQAVSQLITNSSVFITGFLWSDKRFLWTELTPWLSEGGITNQVKPS